MKFFSLLNRQVIVALLLICNSCGSKTEKTSPVIEDITASVYAAGAIKAKNQYTVYPTVSGTISRIFVAENDTIQAGAALFLVKDKNAALNTENAALAANYATAAANTAKLDEFIANIQLAEEKYSHDSAVYQRQKNLWERGIGTKTELEQRELAVKNAGTALNTAKFRYLDLKKQISLSTAQSGNNLTISRNRESDYTVRSEIAGKVYAIQKEPGEMVSPQTAVAVIGSMDAYKLELQVDEYDIVKIKENQEVFVTLDSYKGSVFSARITKVNPLMNERTKTFLVEANFVQPPPSLYPNLTVEANIVIDKKAKALTIPRNYLINDSFVLTSKDHKIKVVTGLKDYQKVEIISGISEKDIIYKPR